MAYPESMNPFESKSFDKRKCMFVRCVCGFISVFCLSFKLVTDSYFQI